MIPTPQAGRTCARALLCWLALCALWLGSARADDAAERARSAFNRGIEASRAAQWLTARAEFKRSIEHVAKPSALFNLALADVMLGLGDEALEALTAFAQLAHGPEYAPMVERSKLLRSLAVALSTRPRPAASGSELMAVPELDAEGDAAALAAEEAFRAGDLARALPALEALYERTHRPELLFNIGVVADRLGASERARLAYQAFAAALPETPQAANARARALLLEQPKPEPPVAPAPEPANSALVVAAPATATPTVAPVLRGTGIALLASGAALFAGALGSAAWLAERIDERADAAYPPTADEMAVPWRKHAIERQFRAAIGTTASLALLAVPLTVLGARALRKAREARPRGDAQVELGPGRFALTLRGRF